MTINLSTSNAKLVLTSAIPVLTSGMKNAVYCEFTFDADWNGLEKVAVFRAGPKSIAVHEANWTTENKLPIPWEVLTEPNQTLYIGICGENDDITVIPTIWCRIADIRRGTDADAPEGREPTPSIWKHLENKIETTVADKALYTIRKIKDYVYEATVLDVDYEAGVKYYESKEAAVPPACSAIRNGNFYGRNLDWTYDQKATFVVRIPRSAGRRASVSICGGLNDLTEEAVRSGRFLDAYKVLPCNAYDGINESGLVASMLVVPTDLGHNRSVPTEDKRAELPAPMLVRYILDNFDTALEAVEYIKKHVAVYFPKALHDADYELHYMIADETKTYCLEFVSNGAVYIDITDNPIMTNFYLLGVTFNEDGSVYTPDTQDEEHNAHITNGITNHGAGLERYNILRSLYDISTSKIEMRSTIANAAYTKAYPTAAVSARWLTEFVGGALTCYAPPYLFDSIRAAAGEAYLSRDRNNPITWQTVHSAVYDIRNRSVSVVFQEDNEEIEFTLKTDTEQKARAVYVNYGDTSSNYAELYEALEDHVPVYCRKTGEEEEIFEAVGYTEDYIRFRSSKTDNVGAFVIAYHRMTDTSHVEWSYLEEQAVSRLNPETQGNVYMTANGTHTGNAKYIGVLFDNSAVENDEDEEALEAHADDPRLKLHGGTRNVDIMATTAEDGKNAVELLGDNKKDNTYLGGLLDPRDGHPHDAANKGYVDSRINAFTVTLAYNAWQAVEPETRSEEPNSDTEAEEDTTIYEQTVNVAALRDVGASEEVTIQICPQPAAIAAWGKYGVVCVEAVAGEFETDGSMTFRASARPATNENISVNVTLLR